MQPEPAQHFRALARHPASLPARLSNPGAGAPHSVRLLNLGLGGACFEIDERYERGERLIVHIDLPGLWDPLVLEAEVAWCEPRGPGSTRAGVRFTQPSGRSLRLIAEALSET
jgi:Tfp pilus assembly protein PilZ